MNDFRWEQRAMRGETLPDDLSQEDQLAYLSMRALYAAYRRREVTRDAAAAEKRKIRLAYDTAARAAAFQRALCEYRVRLIKATEGALNACRKNFSEENARRLCDVLDGMEITIPSPPARGGRHQKESKTRLKTQKSQQKRTGFMGG